MEEFGENKQMLADETAMDTGNDSSQVPEDMEVDRSDWQQELCTVIEREERHPMIHPTQVFDEGEGIFDGRERKKAGREKNKDDLALPVPALPVCQNEENYLEGIVYGGIRRQYGDSFGSLGPFVRLDGRYGVLSSAHCIYSHRELCRVADNSDFVVDLGSKRVIHTFLPDNFGYTERGIFSVGEGHQAVDATLIIITNENVLKILRCEHFPVLYGSVLMKRIEHVKSASFPKDDLLFKAGYSTNTTVASPKSLTEDRDFKLSTKGRKFLQSRSKNYYYTRLSRVACDNSKPQFAKEGDSGAGVFRLTADNNIEIIAIVSCVTETARKAVGVMPIGAVLSGLQLNKTDLILPALGPGVLGNADMDESYIEKKFTTLSSTRPLD